MQIFSSTSWKPFFQLSLFVIIFLAASTTKAQFIDPSLLSGMKYRNIGPHRAGRTVGVTGVASQPNIFYLSLIHISEPTRPY